MSIVINTIISGPPDNGNLKYDYQAFSNLKNRKLNSDTDLTFLNLNAKTAGIDINKTLELKVEPSYDGSANLIINDSKNPLKLVNSRFYLTSSTTYKVADRKGNLDTNIYSSDNFPVESSLIKSVRSIVNLDFLGIFDGGKMPVGNYTFYFKLADSDGNETDFVSESGKIICHIGTVNNPQSIRGGLLDEDSQKLIKLKLRNLDLAYDYINIYYSKSSGDDKQEVVKFYKIDSKFKITNVDTEITITGFEKHVEISEQEINEQYNNFSSVGTLENCQNISFAGKVEKDNSLYETLEKYSLFITPKVYTGENIGFLNHNYFETSDIKNGGEYYNTKNVYYKLGYWNDEIYRIGIVYILNDFTLSPVFNIRGIKELTSTTNFTQFNISNPMNYGEDFILNETVNENVKGVFKIKSSSLFNESKAIKPLGLQFTFNQDVVNGTNIKKGLKQLTKGFFFVRQKRIPTILAQGFGISTCTKTHNPIIGKYVESILTADDNKTKLNRSLLQMFNCSTQNNALICPEATLRQNIYRNFFNGSEYYIKRIDYKSDSQYYQYNNRFYSLIYKPDQSNSGFKTSVLFVDKGTELINNGDRKFRSLAGSPTQAWKHINPIIGDLKDIINAGSYTNEQLSNSPYVVRGEFNSFLGISSGSVENAQLYNIYQKDYNFDNWKDYFKIRYDDSSPFMSISDRYSWDYLSLNGTSNNFEIKGIYRGDCYVSTYTHRMLWNFVDPELPTNKSIVDPWTWYKNYKIHSKYYISKTKEKAVYSEEQNKLFDNEVPPEKMISGQLVEASYEEYVAAGNDSYKLNYNKLLPLFATHGTKIIEPSGKHYSRYAESNGTHGYEQIDRPDVNAVPVGHWVTFKICSNFNLALRDLDFNNPDEEAIHKQKRGFFPLQKDEPSNNLPESTIINNGISQTLSNKYYFEIPDVPFIKISYNNRIYHSDILQEGLFRNGNRVFRSKNYQDYTMEHGSLTKLVEWYGRLIAIMEHGILMIPVNERAAMANETGENIYINTETILPKNPAVLSNTYGSIWPNSIVKTPNCIYGVDTVAKKIWRIKGDRLEIISDFKIQKYLNDNIDLKEGDKSEFIGEIFVKAHYNAFKQDIIFTFKNGQNEWSLCWNEIMNKWITRYSWITEFSENINNIFYTFAKDKSNATDNSFKIWKHGLAGYQSLSEPISTTKWFNKQEPFEFEFIVTGQQGVQKIFDNLKLISNATEPDSFIYEIVGEGYGWSDYKETIATINNLPQSTLREKYLNYLNANPQLLKVPYVELHNDLNEKKIVNGFISTHPIMSELRDLNFVLEPKSGKYKTQIYQKGCNIKTHGRLRGNMHYVEDFWDIQIQPITFKYAYLKNQNVEESNPVETKIREKYIKIRIRYTGTKLSVITAIKTLFTISYD